MDPEAAELFKEVSKLHQDVCGKIDANKIEEAKRVAQEARRQEEIARRSELEKQQKIAEEAGDTHEAAKIRNTIRRMTRASRSMTVTSMTPMQQDQVYLCLYEIEVIVSFL